MQGQSQAPVIWPMLRADSLEYQAVLEVQMGPAAGVCTSRNAADAALSARQAGPHVLSGPRTQAAALCLLHPSRAVPEQQPDDRKRPGFSRPPLLAVLQGR